MKYTTASAFSQALTQAIARLSRETRQSIPRIRRKIAFDRILARLTAVAPEGWLLKGGVALEYRLGNAARATTDMDLSVQNGEAIKSLLRQITEKELNDYFTVRILAEPEKPIVQDVNVYRWSLELQLDGKRFEHLTLDIGVADLFVGTPDALRAEPLLAFADIEPPLIRAIPIEQHIAEKLHAYGRTYNDRESTRVKDLVDLLLLSSYREISGETLRTAIENVFVARATALPVTFALPPTSWDIPFRSLTVALDVTRDFLEAHEMVAGFLDPILLPQSVAVRGRWNPNFRNWT